MKKVLALFLVVFTVLSGCGATIFALTEREQGNVIFTENTLYGDIKYADGADVQRRIYLNDAEWTSVCSIKDGEVSTNTDFRYYNFGREYSGGPDYNNVWLSTVAYPDFGASVRDEQLTEERKKLQNDFDEWTKDSLEKPVVVEFKLNDYYEYYPIGISIWLPEKTNINCEADYEFEDGAINHFREFFKIPIPDIEKTVVEAAVSYGAGGTISTISDKTENFAFTTYSAVCENAVYFTFYNKFPKSEDKVDTSLIPGGYGIYRLPYDKTTDEDLKNASFEETNKAIEEKVYADRLEMVFPLDENHDVTELAASYDKNQVYMMSKENGEKYLTVIDEETMKAIQKIRLDMPGEPWIHTIESGYIVIASYDESGKAYAQVYEINNGLHEKKADVASEFGGFDSMSNVCWNGERLVSVREYDAKDKDENLWTHYEINYSCGFELSVFNSEELLYHGRYESSLDCGADLQGRSVYFCMGEFEDENDLIATIK